MEQRIVIPLYDHTGNEEILEILDRLVEIGLDDAAVERRISPRKLATLTHDEIRIGVAIARQVTDEEAHRART
jgi:hypothetical protein